MYSCPEVPQAQSLRRAILDSVTIVIDTSYETVR